VVNFDLPRSANDYIHRIGRTGRAGQQGYAVALICPDEEEHFRLIEKRMKKRCRVSKLRALKYPYSGIFRDRMVQLV
jgi:ATP-dependent RNA helicase RhlE